MSLFVTQDRRIMYNILWSTYLQMKVTTYFIHVLRNFTQQQK